MRQQLRVLEGDGPPTYNMTESEIRHLIDVFKLSPEKIQALVLHSKAKGLSGWSDFWKNVGNFVKGGITSFDKKDDDKPDFFEEYLKLQLMQKQQKDMENKNNPKLNPMLLGALGLGALLILKK